LAPVFHCATCIFVLRVRDLFPFFFLFFKQVSFFSLFPPKQGLTSVQLGNELSGDPPTLLWKLDSLSSSLSGPGLFICFPFFFFLLNCSQAVRAISIQLSAQLTAQMESFL
jgi:hypothetical protein